MPYNNFMEFIEATAFTKQFMITCLKMNIWVCKVSCFSTQKQGRWFVVPAGSAKSAGQSQAKEKWWRAGDLLLQETRG
jgi:hypothetical protein